MPSDFKVEVVEIQEILEHPNADRLEFARVYGYHVICGKDQYKPGDVSVYLPVDTVLPDKLRDQIFHNTRMTPVSRVRAAKIRGYVSQGMLVPISVMKWYFLSVILGKSKCETPFWPVGKDIAGLCKIEKFQQEVKVQTGPAGKVRPGVAKHPDFKRYTGINHLLRYDSMFEPNERVWNTEKLHGQNFRAGWVPYRPKTRWQRFKHWLGDMAYSLAGYEPIRYEWLVGSHNMEVDPDGPSTWAETARDLDLKNKIPMGQVWFGEMLNTQNNYSYGLPEGKRDVHFFDIWVTAGRYYMDFEYVIDKVKAAGLKMVPMMGGLMPFGMSAISNILNSPDTMSALDPDTAPEGCVVRSMQDDSHLGQRKILKLLSERYLLMKDNTEYH